MEYCTIEGRPLDEWEILAHKLIDKISKLDDVHKKVMKYFLMYRSVGDIIALRELKEKYGITSAEQVILDLIETGLLERGEGCINLPSSLRRYVGRKHGKVKI